MCGHPERHTLFSSPDRMMDVPGEYTYHRCSACASAYQAPRIVDEDLGLAYPDDYYTHERDQTAPPEAAKVGRGARDRIRGAIVDAVQASDDAVEAAPWWGHLLARSRWLRERAFRDLAYDECIPLRRSPGRALDVGCGSGGMLVRLARLGWDVEGLEWDGAAADAARETGFPVRSGDILDVEDGWGPFRLILFNHVFEHLPGPEAALRKIGGLLAPDGRAVLVFPNPQALGAARFGSHWFAWEVPRHLVLPSAGGLSAAAKRAELRMVAHRTLSRAAGAHSAYSRAYRRGEGVSLGAPGDAWDRIFHLAESLLVAMGYPVGEASVVTLAREDAPGP